MFTNAKLTKVNANENKLRTNEIDGKFEEQPKIGECFMFYSDPINNKCGIRVVRTTSVKNVYYGANKSIIFETLNSTYKIEMK